MKLCIVLLCALVATVRAQPVVTPAVPAPTPSTSATPAQDATSPEGAAAATGAELAEPGKLRLSLLRAVELALTQQASLRQGQAGLDAAQARVELAHVPLRPTAQVNATVSEGASRDFFDPSTSSGVSASLTWRLYDFGQSAASIRAAEASAAATAAGVDTVVLDVRSDVEQAYLEAVARQRLTAVAAATLQSEQAHLDQARRFVAAGARDPIEVAQAQARAATAKAAQAQADSNEAVALANLRAAIGWIDPSRQLAIEPGWPQAATEPPPLAELVEAGRAQRPELVQLDRQLLAADANVAAAQAERRPVLSAFASSQWNPSSADWSPQPSWSAGLSLSWQLWDGGRRTADLKVARATWRGAAAQRDALLVSLTASLEAARARILANSANAQASSEAVAAAQAALRFAEARYAQGLGSQIELSDAQSAVTSAEGNLVTAEWQVALAWAQLRRAIGAL